MQIFPDLSLLVLDEEVEMPPQGEIPSLPGLEGLLTFTVESPLPEWEVAIGVDPIVGPEGVLAMEQVTVISPETGGEYVPVVDSPIIAHGIGPEPVQGLWMRLRVGPDWVDAPGLYEGLLHLIPVVPDHVATEVPDPRIRGAGEGGGKVREHELDGLESVGDSTQARIPVGGGIEATVPIELTIGGLTWVLTSESEFHIYADAGPGLYRVEPDLEVVVASNEGLWELRLEGTPFTTGEKEIELERMIWAPAGPGGEPAGPWTPVGSSNLLMSGTGERGVFPATFLLALTISMHDPAGDYVSEITLVTSPI
jgi:hypothetical protein